MGKPFSSKLHKRPTLDGLPIQDATKPVTFIITKRDIKGSKSLDPAHCAAAVACQRVFKTREVRVHLTVTYVRLKDHWERYRTPPAIQREIISFDRTKYFAPGEYRLMTMPPAARLGRGKPTGPKTTTGKKRTFQHLTVGVRRGTTVASAS